MNKEQIIDFCDRYFHATGCQIIEKSPIHLKVKLSPEADRDLTGRTYYWNFVERTGAEPETMSFMFIFDPESHEKNKQAKALEAPQGPANGQSGASILGQYFGMPQILPQPGRMLEETLVHGTRRLEQIIASTKDKGGFLQLFEEVPSLPPGAVISIPYTSWLGVNYKVEFICDMKKEEIYSLGICLSTGEIVSNFQSILQQISLSPRIPPNTSLRERISLERAVVSLESYVENQLKQMEYTWAKEAITRMNEELERVDRYYGDMLRIIDMKSEEREEIEGQLARRKVEIEWQYKPRIEVCPINAGWFHLLSDTFRPN